MPIEIAVRGMHAKAGPADLNLTKPKHIRGNATEQAFAMFAFVLFTNS